MAEMAYPAPVTPDVSDGMTVNDGAIPAVSWEQFLEEFTWLQGEHMSGIGPTGNGKTTLMMQLLPIRDHVVVFGTKPKDSTLDKFHKNLGYKKMRKWSNTIGPRSFSKSLEKYPRRLLWPDASSLYSGPEQQEEFQKALSDIYLQGGWCVYLDELWMLCNHLGLQKEIKTYLQQTRSLDICLVCVTQRPANVPLEIYDMPTHLFFWADNDRRNLDRISGIGGFDSNRIKATVSMLRQHEVLYINTRDRNMMTFFPPDLVFNDSQSEQEVKSA